MPSVRSIKKHMSAAEKEAQEMVKELVHYVFQRNPNLVEYVQGNDQYFFIDKDDKSYGSESGTSSELKGIKKLDDFLCDWNDTLHILWRHAKYVPMKGVKK